MATNPYDDEQGPVRQSAAPAQKITTLHAGQGARVTTRENASQAAEQARVNAEKRFAKRHSSDRLIASANRARGNAGHRAAATQPAGQGPERTRKNIVILVGAAILVLAVILLLVRCVAGVAASDTVQDNRGQQTEAPQQEEQQVTAQADDSVTFQGLTYTIEKQANGNYGVVRRESGASGTVMFEIEGEPQALILYNSVLVIPENRNGGWDVVSYVIVDGSLPAYVTTSDGGEAGGSGSIESAVLQGSAVVVTDSNGNTTSVALE